VGVGEIFLEHLRLGTALRVVPVRM
jgi:hypothetical protein